LKKRGSRNVKNTGLIKAVWCGWLAALLFMPPGAGLAEEGQIYGTGDGFKVTAPEVDVFKKEMVPKQIVPTQQELLRVFLQQRLFALEAEKEGLDSEPALDAELRLVRERSLARAYAERLLARELKVDDTVLESYYLSHIEEYTRPRQFHLYRIVVKEVEEAGKILDQARKAPHTFPDLADAHSVDPATRWKHGEMGTFAEERLLPEIREAVRDAVAGAVLGPIEIHGFQYIFWVKAVQPGTTFSLDSVRDEVREKVTAKKRQEILRKHADTLAARYNFQWEPWAAESGDKPALELGQ